MWLPAGALAVIATAVGCIAVAARLAQRGRSAAVVPILIAAGLIRGYAALDLSLHPWDERYHALVAKHLIADPLTPTLYSDPVLPFDHRIWTSNHVWLHKPPLALWAQAGSMAAFGVNELAMRLPSVIASTASVGVTFLIGRTLFTPIVGLIAATFQTFNGFLVDLVAGRRASDHVDTLLLLVLSTGMFATLATSLRRERLTALPLGIATGIAYMTKAFSGLILLPMWVVYRLMSRQVRATGTEVIGAGIIAAVIILPWSIYTARVFPTESSFEREYALRHITEALEGQGGPPWQYLWEMPRMYGELVYIPVVWAIATWIAGGATIARKAVLLWTLIPYALYSSFATKMPAYVIAAAPYLFILQATFLWRLKERSDAAGSRPSQMAVGIALVIFAILPARYLLEPHGPLEYRDRNPRWAQDLRALNRQIGGARAVVFNIGQPVEAMFYTPYVVYEYLPTLDQVQDLTARGYRVFFFDDGSRALPAAVPSGVSVIRPER